MMMKSQLEVEYLEDFSVASSKKSSSSQSVNWNKAGLLIGEFFKVRQHRIYIFYL